LNGAVLRVPSVLLAALIALLLFAGVAAAETRTAESSTPSGLVFTAEARLVRAAVSYESTGGKVTFDVTTAGEPRPKDEADEPSKASMSAFLFTGQAECGSNLLALYGAALSSSPALVFANEYANPDATAYFGNLSSSALPLPSVEKTVTGTTTTLSASSPSLAEQPFSCATILVQENQGSNILAFPIPGPPAPPAPPAPTPPAPAPALGPAALSIAKAKPLQLKVGKSKVVKVRVTNTGATATATGSLRVKPVAGVMVTPEVQKLPPLAPGASSTVSVRVKLTKAAKKRSTLAVTGAAGTVTGKGSLAVQLAS
jgi:hypothetical protein